jgi:hypothetical protein
MLRDSDGNFIGASSIFLQNEHQQMRLNLWLLERGLLLLIASATTMPLLNLKLWKLLKLAQEKKRWGESFGHLC